MPRPCSVQPSSCCRQTHNSQLVLQEEEVGLLAPGAGSPAHAPPRGRTHVALGSRARATGMRSRFCSERAPPEAAGGKPAGSRACGNRLWASWEGGPRPVWGAIQRTAAQMWLTGRMGRPGSVASREAWLPPQLSGVGPWGCSSTSGIVLRKVRCDKGLTSDENTSAQMLGRASRPTAIILRAVSPFPTTPPSWDARTLHSGPETTSVSSAFFCQP